MKIKTYQAFCLLGLTCSKNMYTNLFLHGLHVHLLLSLISVVQALSVVPRFIPEIEGDPEVHFFCREDTDIFAIDIVWQDPQNIIYNPGSTSDNGNEKIHAEGSRLSIFKVNRNDTGTYRCLRNSNYTEFAVGNLSVIGMYMHHTWSMYVHYLHV